MLIVKLPSVKLESAKRGFFFTGGTLYSPMPLEIQGTKAFGSEVSKYKLTSRDEITSRLKRVNAGTVFNRQG